MKTGKWIIAWEDSPIYKCSTCGGLYYLSNDFNYCPNCGAYMKTINKVKVGKRMSIVSDITSKLNKIVSEQSELFNQIEYYCSLSFDDIVTIKLAVGLIEMLQEKNNTDS